MHIYIYMCTEKYIHTCIHKEKYPFTLAARYELNWQTDFVVEKWGQAQGGRPSALSEAQQKS